MSSDELDQLGKRLEQARAIRTELTNVRAWCRQRALPYEAEFLEVSDRVMVWIEHEIRSTENKMRQARSERWGRA